MAETPPAETPPAESAPPAEGEPATETPAPEPEGEPKDPKAPEAAKPTAEIEEETLRAAALRWANKTMAASRRAQAAAESVKTENTRLASENQAYKAIVEELRANPFAGIRKLGFDTVRAFVDAGIAAGGEPPKPTAEDSVAELRREIRERDERAAREQTERVIEESKRAVFAAVDKATDRYDLATTEVGHARLWDAIVAYNEQYGFVPDEAVYRMADLVEEGLETEFSKSRKFSVQRPDVTKQGATAAEAATAARNGGKTLTNAGKGAPAQKRELSLDPDERRKQIDAELRAEGIIR